MSRRRVIIIFALAAILLLAALVRFHGLTDKSLWEDEIYSLNALGVHSVDQPLPEWAAVLHNVFRYYHDDNHPLLFFVLLGAWLKLFGGGVFAVRAFPVMVNLATLPVICLLAWRIFRNWETVLVTAVLFGSSAYMVYYAQEARMYALLVLLCCLSMLFFLKMQEDGRIRNCAGFALCSALGLYTHYYYVFFIGVQVLHWAVSGARRSWRFLLSLSSIGLVFLPWLPVLLYQISQKYHSDLWIRNSSGEIVGLPQAVFQGAHILFRFAVGENFIYPTTDAGVRQILWVTVALGLIVVLQRPTPAGEGRNGRLLGLWLLMPLVGGFAADLLLQTRTLEVSKYFITSYPALALILASAIVRFRWKRARFVPLLALIVVNMGALSVYYRIPKTVEWRDVAGYLSSRIGPGDVLLSPEPRVYTCVVYYLGSSQRAIQIPYDSSVDYILGQASKHIAQSPNLWLVAIDHVSNPRLQGLPQRLAETFPLVSSQTVSEYVTVSSFANRRQDPE